MLNDNTEHLILNIIIITFNIYTKKCEKCYKFNCQVTYNLLDLIVKLKRLFHNYFSSAFLLSYFTSGILCCPFPTVYTAPFVSNIIFLFQKYNNRMSTSTTTESGAKVDLGVLEEDDEFEEFPADGRGFCYLLGPLGHRYLCYRFGGPCSCSIC